VTRAGIRVRVEARLVADALRPRSDAGPGERGGWAARMRSGRPANCFADRLGATAAGAGNGPGAGRTPPRDSGAER